MTSVASFQVAAELRIQNRGLETIGSLITHTKDAGADFQHFGGSMQSSCY